MSQRDVHTRRWEIADAIDHALRTRDADAETYEARLAVVLDKFAHSRTIQAQMLREVADLALGRVAELQAQHAAELDALAQRHAGELEGQAAAHEARVARLEKSRDDWQQMCQSAQQRLDERRTIRQELEQAAGEDDAKVTISNGHVGWTVAGLEEISYRLRTGGATDDTPVAVEMSRATAMVPAPNLVHLDASPKAKAGLADLQDQLPERDGGISFATALRVGAGVALVLILLLVKLVIL